MKNKLKIFLLFLLATLFPIWALAQPDYPPDNHEKILSLYMIQAANRAIMMTNIYREGFITKDYLQTYLQEIALPEKELFAAWEAYIPGANIEDYWDLFHEGLGKLPTLPYWMAYRMREPTNAFIYECKRLGHRPSIKKDGTKREFFIYYDQLTKK